jgi:phosphoglycerate dehydrogenase-like enzyme
VVAKQKILVLDPLSHALSEAVCSRLDPEQFDWIVLDGDGEDTLSLVADADFLISNESDIGRSILTAARDVRLIIKYQSGAGELDWQAIEAMDIPLIEIPRLPLHSVAEFAVLSILALAKEYATAVIKTREQVWLPDLQPKLTTQSEYAYNWVELERFDTVYGKTVGIIGLGTIGQSVAGLLQPFGVEVIYTDLRRLKLSEERRLGVTYVELEELFRRSDFVTLHIRLSKDTEKFMDSQKFGMMKPTAFFINTSRGRVVDEEALYDAVSKGKIAGAALDVFRMEPLPSNSPLWELEDVIITPHVAGTPVDKATVAEAAAIVKALVEHSDRS